MFGKHIRLIFKHFFVFLCLGDVWGGLSESVQGNLVKRRPSGRRGKVKCQNLICLLNRFSLRNQLLVILSEIDIIVFRIIITYNNGGYTDPDFFFREVNERSWLWSGWWSWSKIMRMIIKMITRMIMMRKQGSCLWLPSGLRELRGFLAACLIQNHFLIQRMLRFSRHSQERQ